MITGSPPDGAEVAPGNPWVPMTVVMVATLMVALDSTIVNVALHQIGESLGAGAGIEWVVIAYLLAVCASQPATGWLADRFGRRRVFLASVVAFTTASLLCGLAPNLGFLIAFRVLQGLGGGALMPVGMAIAFELFPSERRGRAMATWGMAAMVAPAVGPTVGGWLVTAVSWHWMFFINVPIGVVAIVAGRRLLPTTGHVERRRFDAVGLLLGSSGLVATVLGVSEGSRWGWGSPSTLTVIPAGVAMLAAFVVWERHRDEPLIELSMFGISTFRVAMAAAMFLIAAQYGRLVFIPLQLESLRGYSALRVGLLFMPAAVASAAGMQLGGRLVDRVGAKLPVAAGSVGAALAMLGFSRLGFGASIWWVAGLMSWQGFCWGTTMSPTVVAGMSEIPSRLLAQASAVRTLAQQVAAAVSVAVLGAVASTRMGTNPTDSRAWDAYRSVYLVAGIGAVGAALIALRLPSQVRHAPDADSEVETDIALLLE